MTLSLGWRSPVRPAAGDNNPDMHTNSLWLRRRRRLLAAWLVLGAVGVILLALTVFTCRYEIHKQYDASRPTYGYVVSVFAGRLHVSHVSGTVPGYSRVGFADRWWRPRLLPRASWSAPSWWFSLPFWIPAAIAAGGAWWVHRRWRHVRITGVCTSCGYEIGNLAVCPECGMDLEGVKAS